MKNAIRAFVAILVLTGAVASSQISSASTTTKVTTARVSMLPIPSCAPDDANACGLGTTR